MKNKLIIFFTMSLWNEPHRGRHHYATQLSKDNVVVWVNRTLSWKENYESPNVEEINGNLYVLHTGKSLLPHRFRVSEKLNNNRRIRLLNDFLKKKIGRKPDLLWLYDFTAEKITKYYSNSKSIYFCNDYFGEEAFLNYEVDLARKVNYVFCTAPKLMERFKKINENSYFIPHGIWPNEVPKRYEKKKNMDTVGYIGTLNNTLDLNFFYEIIKNTNCQLIIGGPIIESSHNMKNQYAELFNHDRVSYIGNLNKKQMMLEISKLDVCLIPYKCDKVGEYRFALKFLEYLSMGKPIVATPFFDWPSPYNEFVNIYKGNNSLDSFLTSVYNNWDYIYFEKALNICENATWESRVEEINQLIYKELVVL